MHSGFLLRPLPAGETPTGSGINYQQKTINFLFLKVLSSYLS